MTGEPFDIAWTATSRRALSQLPEKVGTAVVELCYGPLADDPARLGKPLRFELEGLHSARRGDYRVIYRIDPGMRRVEIVAIEHRSQAYRPRKRQRAHRHTGGPPWQRARESGKPPDQRV